MAGGMPLYRFMGNRVTKILENVMLGSRFTELHSGLRAYTRRCLLSLPFRRYSNGFLFDSELLVDAVTFGQRVVEVPIPTRYTQESSSISIGPSLAYIAGSLGYCARQVAVRGRRGRRSASARAAPQVFAPPDAAEQTTKCPACGAAILPGDGGRLEVASGRTGAGGWRCSRCGLRAFAHRADGHEARARPISREEISALLDVADEYFVPGNRMLAFGAADELVTAVAGERGWHAAHAGVGDEAANSPPASKPNWAPAARRDGGQVDAILFFDPSGELPDAADALRRLRPILEPDGLLVLATSTFGGRGFARTPPVAGRYALTDESIRAVLTLSGFRVVELRGSRRIRSDGKERLARVAVSRLREAPRFPGRS
jgi:hypothetical protein